MRRFAFVLTFLSLVLSPALKAADGGAAVEKSTAVPFGMLNESGLILTTAEVSPEGELTVVEREEASTFQTLPFFFLGEDDELLMTKMVVSSELLPILKAECNGGSCLWSGKSISCPTSGSGLTCKEGERCSCCCRKIKGTDEVVAVNCCVVTKDASLAIFDQ